MKNPHKLELANAHYRLCDQINELESAIDLESKRVDAGRGDPDRLQELENELSKLMKKWMQSVRDLADEPDDLP